MSLLALAIPLALIGCGGSGSAYGGVTGPPATNPPPNASTLALGVRNNYYTPATDSVAVGATLTWSWNSCTSDGYGGSMCTSHSVQFDDGSPSSQVQSSGTFRRTFTAAGTYTYHCAVHGAAMAGKIIVQ